MQGKLPIEDIAAELRELVSMIRRRALAEPGEGLPHPLRQTLRRLELDGPATTADLARGELMTPQSMGAIVAKLEALGLVSRADDPVDGRRRVVALTAEGRRSIARRHSERRTWLAGVLEERLTSAELRTLAAALPALRKLVS